MNENSIKRTRGRRSLGATIHHYREQSGLSQRQLAAMVGMHHSVLARIESDEVTQPSAELLQRLSDALDIDASELLAYIGVKPSLPEPHVYFRKAYGMSEAQAREAVKMVEERYINMKTQGQVSKTRGGKP